MTKTNPPQEKNLSAVLSQHFLAALGLIFPFRIHLGPSVIPSPWDMGILGAPKPRHTPFPVLG